MTMLKVNEVVELTKNVAALREYLMGSPPKYNFQPSMRRPLSVKRHEGTHKLGEDTFDLYRLSGGLVKAEDGVFIDIDELLIPACCIRKWTDAEEKPVRGRRGKGGPPKCEPPVPNDFCTREEGGSNG
jgi:hypothetical protein